MIKEKIIELAGVAVRKLFNESPEILIEKPANSQFGDYAVNIAFTLSKQLRKSSQETANALASEISKDRPAEIERIEAINGYVNFFLAPKYLWEQLGFIYKNRQSFGQSKIGSGETVIVEYSQPNIAKPMHVGHLRNTILGDALANILEFSGYKIIRWNYIGDWGTQFGKLIAAYKLWGEKKEIEDNPIPALVALYVKFHEELKQHPELERRGQEEFAKLEEGDKENRKLWQWFRKESLKEFDKIYGPLGVRFDLLIGESFFEKELGPLVDNLIKNGIAVTGEEGAIIINLAKAPFVQRAPLQGLGVLAPALIRKADGASLYLTRDIANLKYRVKKYKPAKILYVVGSEQSLHFQQLFAIAQILGLDGLELNHIKYGLVLGRDKKKMSTREGSDVSVKELVKKAIDLAQKIIEQKKSSLSGKESRKIAETVGIGALKYEMLKEHRSSDIVFDWERMLDFTGNSGPYLQYTYARLSSILAKAGKIGKTNFGMLGEPSELAIAKHLLEFPDTIANSARTYLTNNLALYLYELANLANRFYESVPVLKDDDSSRRNARLVLITVVAAVLKTGLNLLGIKTLEKI